MTQGTVVIRNIERADAGAVKRLGAAGVATVHEAAGRVGLCQPDLRPIYPGGVVAGPAVTALCTAGDNLMVHLAVECCQPGDVLVVGVTSPCTQGFIGELLATSLRAHGAIGVVIDAGVRDVAVLKEMQFPVWSRAISAQGTAKATPGAVNVPVVCGGQLFRPGDAVVADDDGVVCIPAGDAASVADKAEDRIRREDATREKLARGELGVDIYGYRELAARLGITYVGDATRA
jgi:4-hydroxy-4-methyl-2-oxoglutarate aldolase